MMSEELSQAGNDSFHADKYTNIAVLQKLQSDINRIEAIILRDILSSFRGNIEKIEKSRAILQDVYTGIDKTLDKIKSQKPVPMTEDAEGHLDAIRAIYSDIQAITKVVQTDDLIRLRNRIGVYLDTNGGIEL